MELSARQKVAALETYMDAICDGETRSNALYKAVIAAIEACHTINQETTTQPEMA